MTDEIWPFDIPHLPVYLILSEFFIFTILDWQAPFPFRWLIPDGWGTTLWLLISALVLAYLLHSAEMPAVKIETVTLVLVNVVPFAVLVYLVYGEGWGLPGPYGMSI